ncbi:MAG: HAD family hydrolase [Lachnospiraceae bacterium]|nr:HAD family hydrolase [Lachnospiraceae bacterium]
MEHRYFLFDLDGTLTDSAPGITNSVMYALNKYNIRVSDRRELYTFIGPPLTDSFMTQFGFSKDQALEAISYYREYYKDTGIFENSVYEGIPELLSGLKKRNAFIALATSKPYEFAVRILEHFELYQYFDHVGAATMDGSIAKKTDVIKNLLSELNIPDLSSVLMIGDRDQDIDGAKANSLKSVGVLWGFGTREELEGSGADYIISKPEELLSIS